MSSPDQKARTDARRIVGGQDFRHLVGHLEKARAPKHTPGAHPRWVRVLAHVSSETIAATIFYHVLRAHLQAENREKDLPFLSTIGADLGADLLPQDRDNRDNLPMKIGTALLEEAREHGLIESWRDARGGIRVIFARPTQARLDALIAGAKPTPHRVRAPDCHSVTTRKPHAFLLQRPAASRLALDAAHKIQGTAWRVNRAMLAALEETPHRKNAHRKSVLWEARFFATFDRFYLPTFFDFRGRVYQDGSLLQYTGGSDYARSLLEFEEGAFVDQNGERWLRWHAQQMWGHDKAGSFGDGTDWLRRTMPRLLKDGEWRKAGHPFQFLAAIFALRDAHEGFPVHLPVRVDASCSGLQHLAWLTGDRDIAPHVNLWGDYHGSRSGSGWLEINRQRDFYDLVTEAVGTKRGRRRRKLSSVLTRKDCKSVIVPMLYGQTVGGAIAGLLPESWNADGPSPALHLAERDAKDIRRIAEALAPKSFGLLKWFKSVAADHAGSVIHWHTPSGFHVVQDYRCEITDSKGKPRQVPVIWEGKETGLRLRTYSEALDRDQQQRSLAANVIHSFDAALLHELVGGSRIDSWAVAHDAFAVHPIRIDELLDVDLQRAMEQMYTPDRAVELAKEWKHDGVWPRGALPREMLGGLRTLG